MQNLKAVGWMVGTLVVLLLAGAMPAYGIEAGITLDVHQDIGPDQPGLWPNDFHIEGLVCSNNGVVPMVIDHVDGPFPHFAYSINKVNPGDPSDCWYWVEASWWGDPHTGYIPFCTVIHLGVLFEVDTANVVVDLIGWWTQDGIPVGQIYGGLRNQGYVPAIGFNVVDQVSPQVITIGNGDLPITPALPPPPIAPPWPPAGISLLFVQAEVVPFPPGAPPPFRELWEFGQQQGWPWIPVIYDDGTPVSRSRPVYLAPSSFFDIFLESAPPPGSGRMGVQDPFTIAPGGFVVMRQLVGFLNNSTREYEERWFWEIHGAQGTEACCFTDGGCADLPPFVCLNQGGQPMGPGSSCYPVNPCPQGAFGACCFGVGPQCIVTDQVTCVQQFLGAWMGAGTTCADMNGNGIADICELPVMPEACCFPDGSCVMLPSVDCELQGGTPMGAGTWCLGDHNENGRDDLCEAKWTQLPDLSTAGIDVNASQPFILADDFECRVHSLITDIAVWGSWRQDILPDGSPSNVQFVLSLHADIPDPDGPGPLYSMPGQVLWSRVFPPGSFTVRPFQAGLQEGWMDPPAGYIFPGDTVCWLYYFQIPASEAFCQQGTEQAPMVYWLDVQAQPLSPVTPAQFGWKTSIRHWNDAAVWGMGQEPYPGPWNELRYPPQHPQQMQAIDLAFAIGGEQPCAEFDFGDAPDQPYPTLLGHNGARHAIVPGVMLGVLIDAEPDGQPVPAGLGDDVSGLPDEDGVVFGLPLRLGRPTTVVVTASVPGTLTAWIDFDRNGSWAEADNQVFPGVPLVAGPNPLVFFVPPQAQVGKTFARFRFTTAPGPLPFDGPAPDGEVEDYRVEIACACPGDVNADGWLDGRDVQCFVDCVLSVPTPICVCMCADLDGNGVVDLADVAPFVHALINQTGPCP